MGIIAAMMKDTGLLLGRVLLGLIFVTSGYGKVMHLDAFAQSLASRGVPMSGPLSVLGALVEFLGGVAIVIGLQVRWASLLMMLFVVVATLISHRYWEIGEAAARRAQQTQFMKNVAIFGGFLLLMASGGGRFSLDRLFGRKS
jgi:putative oxidoreductase